MENTTKVGLLEIPQKEQIPEKIKYCLYARKSTEIRRTASIIN